MGPLRIALIGAGRRGQAHAATISELPDLFDFAAICDVNEASARRSAERFGGEAYANVRELFRREGLNAVVIATPPDTHHVVARAAAEAGVHMLIETPLALTRAMMDFIAEVAAKAGAQVEVGENYGRRPAEQLNRAAIQAGLIGRVVHLCAFNAPMNHGTCYHTMSQFRLYAGADVAEVQAIEHRHDLDSAGDLAGETWSDAVLTFENGVTASISCVSGWNGPLRAGRPRLATVEGTAGHLVSAEGAAHRIHRLEAAGTVDYALKVESRSQGGREIPLRYSYGEDSPVEFANPFADRYLTDSEPAGIADGIARALELRSLYRCVVEGGTPEYGLERARRSQELGIAMAESARLRRPIKATLGPETGWEREQHEALRSKWGADPFKDVDLILAR